MRLVVIGNGMAGARLVDEVRARDKDARVTVFGAETRAPYNRVLLSNVLAGTAAPDHVRLPEPAAGVSVRLGVTVTAIDRAARTVRTACGQVEPYDVLVLATGSEPFLPPVPGVEHAIAFRTMDDCVRILRRAGTAEAAVVIGGGLLGVEAARGLAGRGMPVTLLHLAGHLMDRQLDAEAGLVLGEALAGLGVTVRTGADVTAVRADGVELGGGELLPAGLVVLACGVRPVVGLAREAGLAVDRGVVVDDRLRTSDPAVYAIGECAQHDGRVYGLVAPAWEQAVVVADLVTGADPAARYRGSRLVTRLKARSVELAAMGETHLTEDAAGQVEVVRFTHRARGIYRKLVIRDDRLVGAILLGEAPTVGTLTQLFDRGGPLPGDPAGLLFPGLSAATPADSPVRMPDSARVCECNNVTKGRIRACWEDGARDLAAVTARTRATTGCGSCRDAVEGIIGWLCEQEEVHA
ncbi:FAD/NAD(P)-binding oxidoreductase [Sphaerisporangium rufum]|uniref:FAD/NAD(P)-binding oxidoreductase n=1 Tax=Sphaerisporangium rufum TaxID=1381558 RepID=A0A919UZJ4_9ACTN|nr:FAD-dependent oxidoreductase [Sphaerisporangium rufum]GII79151.1 FAD/NAD(P)-binding oxidoreductase [Sphaerisporangium rufum]